MAHRKPVEEMRQDVHRLREEGLSFSRIGDQLGISKAYAIKLSKPVTNRSPISVTNGRSDRCGSDRRPNARQRKFAKALAEGKSNRQAAMDAALPATLSESGADSYANRTLQNGQFRETFEKMLDRKGLSEERIAEVHAENLEATKVVATATKEGKITDVLERPDYATRQRAVQTAYRVRGRDQPDEDGSSQPLILVLREETKRKAERLAGKTLDIQTIPVEDDDESHEIKQIESAEPRSNAPVGVDQHEEPAVVAVGEEQAEDCH